MTLESLEGVRVCLAVVGLETVPQMLKNREDPAELNWVEPIFAGFAADRHADLSTIG